MDDSEDNVVTRALRSVLDQVPTMPDTAIPETGTLRQQPWADVAATAGTDKRSLEALVAEYEQRIAASPDAKIPPNPGPSPSEAYFNHLSNAPQEGRKRRRRSRGRRTGTAARSGPAAPTQAQNQRQQPAPRDGATPAPRRRRRRRRGPRPSSPPPE